MLYEPRRHGDIVVSLIPESEAKKLLKQTSKEIAESKETVLAYGEVTGHAHRVTPDGVVANVDRPAEQGGKINLLYVEEGTKLSHEEHRTFKLPKGLYAFGQKRQYSDSTQGWERVVD